MSTHSHATREDLQALVPGHETFVGIDSDGCVFDTMEIKQKQCFHPQIISHWSLEAIEKELREAAEFTNLYSKWRGQNRFLTLVLGFDLLRTRPEVIAAGADIPQLDSIRRLIDSGQPLSNGTLTQTIEQTGDAELQSVLSWSLDVNKEVARIVRNVPPFKWARECLERIATSSDAICVSQTPTEALVREWEENKITHLVSLIAGQELGTKAEHLELATGGRYAAGKVLMIGDAPGDRKAAEAVDARFYPINPGDEATSWKRLHDEAYDLFLAGNYTDDYESGVIHEFEALLPDTPPWEAAG